MHPGKRGVIGAHEPPALRKLGLDMQHWTMKVKGIGSGYRITCKFCVSRFFLPIFSVPIFFRVPIFFPIFSERFDLC